MGRRSLDQNGRRPKWKTTKMENNQNGRRPKWKTTKMEDDLIDVGDCGWSVNQPGLQVYTNPTTSFYYILTNEQQLMLQIRPKIIFPPPAPPPMKFNKTQKNR